MKIEKMKWITRDIVRANPDKLFLFGDNFKRAGYGGQAKEMRGEPNTFGIAVKFTPSRDEKAFFTEKGGHAGNCGQIDLEFNRLANTIRDGHYTTVVIPSDGIGTGLAELDKRAPKTFAYLQEKLAELESL